MKRTAEPSTEADEKVFQFSVVRFTDFLMPDPFHPALKRWANFIPVRFADANEEQLSGNTVSVCAIVL